MKISAVIPTRNRPAYLARTLLSLLSQTRPPDEILVVDSSNDANSVDTIRRQFEGHAIRWLTSPVSVCVQRNIGIRNASGDWIFLCDDDIEFEPDYIQRLEAYADADNKCGVVAGRLMQLESGKWVDRYPVKSFLELTWRFIFQLSVWGDTNTFKVHRMLQKPYSLINNFYKRRGNTLSLSGWPLVTQWHDENFKTTVFSLGANLVKRTWLDEGYDEVLDPYGIGDNYGVAMNFPPTHRIHVVGSAVAYHHRAEQNRLDESLAYYRRILALHYFLLKHKKGLLTRVFFMWSLFGNVLSALLKNDWLVLKATVRTMVLILLRRNPYWIGHLKNHRGVQPVF